MNYVFISPNFPFNYVHFCERLRSNGCNVLGIGDAPYEGLSDELKNALTEYYRVDTLEDYDAVYRAAAYYAFRYGRIDWIESNNEYWLALDAKLREDFNVSTGVRPEELSGWKSKYAMKPVYKSAGIPSARSHRVTDISSAKGFIEDCGGYPVFAKPELGVGATDTFRIDNEEDLQAFFSAVSGTPYVIEEYVEGDIYSYDAIVDSEGSILFESCFKCPNVAESVNEDQEVLYYVLPDIPDQLRNRGRKAVKAFGVRQRFIHFEFFRLSKARKGLGEAGDFVGLEVNMRPAGGYTTDMIDFAHSCDVYQIYADMVTHDKRLQPENGKDRYCAFASRKDSHSHEADDSEVLDRYRDRIVMHGRMPDIFAAAMGNRMFIAVMDTFDELVEYGKFILEDGFDEVFYGKK